MKKRKGYDFCGWASTNDLTCEDGVVIRKDAFANQDGDRVTLVYNHGHDDIKDIIGHAYLENRDEGVYCYGYINNTPSGQHAKECLKHGDVTSLSIWANNLTRKGREILHGVIREVSLVLAGANPGAYVESVISHGFPMDEDEDECILYTGKDIVLMHGSISENEEDEEEEDDDVNNKSVMDVINDMTDEQKEAVAIAIGAAVQEAKGENDEEDEEEEDDDVRHSIFDQNNNQEDEKGQLSYISHSQMKDIIKEAKKCGSLREAVETVLDLDTENGEYIAHSIDTTGMTTATGTQTYGVNDVSMLYPEARSLNTPPEFISRKMTWVGKLMGRIHRTPFSRIKSMYADITEDEARAKGYIKGKQKKEEVFTTLKRTTTPQTVYKKQKLDKDDILDITEFDVVAWIRGEMLMMLDEEIARAILIGDGRPSDSDDKIKEEHIRPIISDVPLFNVLVKVSVPADADAAVIAKNTIDAVIRSRKSYKGSGSPVFWTTEDVLTEMLLLEDGIGHKLYKTEAEISTALRVSEVVPVEPMEGHKLTIDGTAYPLIGTIVNPVDYNVGADPRADSNNILEDFDIDFNQYKYLIEKRMSGALVKPFSAITLVLDKKSV